MIKSDAHLTLKIRKWEHDKVISSSDLEEIFTYLTKQEKVSYKWVVALIAVTYRIHVYNSKKLLKHETKSRHAFIELIHDLADSKIITNEQFDKYQRIIINTNL